MDISEKQKYGLKKFIKEMEQYKGRHTELVSVYIPKDYDIIKVINHLEQEKGTATNIKSTATRKNVIDALEKMTQHLRLYKRTPENGLAAFAGNVAEREGQQDFKVWSIEPPLPLKTRIYRCDKEFVLELLREMLETKEVYGLVVVDRRDANIAFLKGKSIIPTLKTHSEVPGKTKAGGQCLVKGSLIQMSDGSLSKIELIHNPHKVKSIMNNSSIGNSNILDKWDVKKSQIYKIITKNPRLEVESSKDHVFFAVTTSGIIEKAAEDLKIGDLLIMPEKISIEGEIQHINSLRCCNSFTINKGGKELLKQQRLKKRLHQRQLAKKLNITQTGVSVIELGKRNINGALLGRLCNFLDINFEEFLKKYCKPYLYRPINLPDKIDETFAQFIGYFMGDGCIENDRITFFEQNKKVAAYYKNKFEKYFGINISYRFRKDKNYHQLRITSRPLVRLIRDNFPETKKALNSEIPHKILKSKDNIAASFLRGFFDAEGYSSENQRVGIGINNRLLAKQLQMLLLRYGIISSFLEYDNRRNPYSKNARYTLDISEKKSLELFKKKVGFTSLEKIEKLDRVLEKKSNISYVRQILIHGSKIRGIIEKAGYNLKLFPKVSIFFRNERMMSKEIFKNSILANIKDKTLYKQLKEICDLPLLPVKISKIEVIEKITDMVDVSVKDQNFIANGIFVHNSAARYERLREGAKKEHFKKVAEYMKEQFLGNKSLKGIIVGGPGPTKYDFIDTGYIATEVRNKIIGIKDLSYTGEFGLRELVEKSEDILANESIMAEKKIMAKFFELLSSKAGKVSYGVDEVMKNLKLGIVDTLLLSEELEDKKIEEFENEAKKMGTNVQIISTETMEGIQLRDIGKVAAILRYEVHS
ncbi:helix-turn-helix domain-containing protein [Candidatus Woesearchaeota archaeon]|nr:helix-turn-helix domain-containing protein [Candidatus Woesearchaeota archaeon]